MSRASYFEFLQRNPYSVRDSVEDYAAVARSNEDRLAEIARMSEETEADKWKSDVLGAALDQGLVDSQLVDTLYQLDPTKTLRSFTDQLNQDAAKFPCVDAEVKVIRKLGDVEKASDQLDCVVPVDPNDFKKQRERNPDRPYIGRMVFVWDSDSNIDYKEAVAARKAALLKVNNNPVDINAHLRSQYALKSTEYASRVWMFAPQDAKESINTKLEPERVNRYHFSLDVPEWASPTSIVDLMEKDKNGHDVLPMQINDSFVTIRNELYHSILTHARVVYIQNRTPVNFSTRLDKLCLPTFDVEKRVHVFTPISSPGILSNHEDEIHVFTPANHTGAPPIDGDLVSISESNIDLINSPIGSIWRSFTSAEDLLYRIFNEYMDVRHKVMLHVPFVEFKAKPANDEPEEALVDMLQWLVYMYPQALRDATASQFKGDELQKCDAEPYEVKAKACEEANVLRMPHFLTRLTRWESDDLPHANKFKSGEVSGISVSAKAVVMVVRHMMEIYSPSSFAWNKSALRLSMFPLSGEHHHKKDNLLHTLSTSLMNSHSSSGTGVSMIVETTEIPYTDKAGQMLRIIADPINSIYGGLLRIALANQRKEREAKRALHHDKHGLKKA